MTVPRVLHGELVQPELGGHLVELVVRRLEQRHPDEAIGPAHVFADVGSRDIGDLAAVLVRHAGDEHRS